MTELDREEKLPFPPHDKVGDYYNKGEIDWINQKLASAKEEGARESSKNWYFEGDELVITKGKWVIDRYKKHKKSNQ